jgi:transcriptional regulator with PAS, ATPase and Fis domain
LLPRAIYDTNPCGNFAPIDCGSMVGPLMESESFGRTEGAFTGVAQAKHLQAAFSRAKNVYTVLGQWQ